MLIEYRVTDLNDTTDAIQSLFINRPVDMAGEYFLPDVSMMSSPEIIYDVFISNALIGMLYLKNNLTGDLSSLPSFFKKDKLESNRTNLHYIKFNNLLLGVAIKLTNASTTEYNPQIIDNVYKYLRTTANNTVPAAVNITIDSDLDPEAMIEEYPENVYLKRYNDLSITYLIPGELNYSVAYYIAQQTRPYFYEYSSYLKEIDISLFFFNPISEVYIEFIFTYTKTIQGTISFSTTMKGGFPLLYSSHQFNEMLLTLYFVIKIVFITWTTSLFLYGFLTVSDDFYHKLTFL